MHAAAFRREVHAKASVPTVCASARRAALEAIVAVLYFISASSLKSWFCAIDIVLATIGRFEFVG